MKQLGLRRRPLLPFLLATAALLLASGPLFYWIELGHMEEEFARNLAAMRTAYERTVSHHSDKLGAVLAAVLQDGRMGTAFRSRDRAALMELLGKDAHRLLAPNRYQAAFEQGWRTFRETGTDPVVGKTLELQAARG